MKKLIISSDVLAPALKKLSQAVNPKAINPLHKNIYCRITKGQLEMITTDMEITISVKCEVETGNSEEFDILLPFEFISEICKYTGSEPVTIEHPSARKAKIIAENDVYEINSLDKTEEFTKLPGVPKKSFFRVGEEFVSLLHKAMLTVSTDKIRGNMNKTCLDLKGKEAFLVSTDAHFMYRYKLAIETETPEQLLFSAKMAKALDGIKDMEVSWSAKQIVFKGDNTIVWATRHEDKFPNYAAVIPAYSANLVIDKPELVKALHKACISNVGTKQTTLLLTKEKGRLHFDADDTDNSRKINVNIPAEYSGEAEYVSINAKKMLTVLDQFEAEKVNLHIHTWNKAVLVSTDDENYLGLIMPLLIDKKS